MTPKLIDAFIFGKVDKKILGDAFSLYSEYPKEILGAVREFDGRGARSDQLQSFKF